ncbi:MAG: hypothetical protein KDK28_21045 [Maritimibacter sp.]|nr:hypothetical protein [Maritimibacter sp.]
MASAFAGFGLVSLMFPNSGLPGTGGAPLTAAAYMPAPVSVSVMPAAQVARYEPAPVPAPVLAPSVAPAPALLDRPDAAMAAVDAAPVAPVTVEAPVRVAAKPAPVAPAVAPTESHTVIATKGTALAETEAPMIDTSGFGPRIAALPSAPANAPATQETALVATPPAEPETFAMLADDDATARAGAGLFSGRTAPGAAAAVQTDPVRPAQRPDGFAAQHAAYAPAMTEGTEAAPAEIANAAPTRSIRPAPRPEVILAAATVPAAPAAAPAALAPPTNVVEVSARQRSGGFLSGGSSSCGRTLARAMPSRKGGATGSAFFAGLTNVSGPERDARIIAELARGNMPGFLHDLQPVTFKGQDARGAAVEITLCVTPDYLALGSDQDYVRVPLGLPAAARIAGAFDMTLPTPRMVDAIYAQAGIKLSPAPMPPGSQMSSTSYFVTHNTTIEGQLKGRRGLVAGHKKDVVMASRMASAPGRVAIYGWHQRSGAPIQPVSTVHGANYADYSHGIRLVSKTAYLNGKAVALDDLLSSSRYADLLNTDGPMPGPVIRTASN